MFLIIKLFIGIIFFFVMLTVITGLSLFMKIRNHLNPVLKKNANRPAPPPGDGDIIEGEYKVIDDGK